MVIYFVVGSVAFLASGLTLFSGFGLGTILMPVFALIFPIDLAISLTAIVHFLNNLFKLSLLGRQADKKVLIMFGLPALAAAYGGALLLFGLEYLKPILKYHLWGSEFTVTPIKLTIAFLMIVFSTLEIIPRFQKIVFDKNLLPLGGIVSGFFGGLSGHQGALRSMFLLKCGLSKESFVATGIVLACLVDLGRISVYSSHLLSTDLKQSTLILLTAVLSAFLGAFIGNRLVKKVTLKAIQIIVSTMLFVIAGLLGAGLI